MSAQILKMKSQPLRGFAASPRLKPRYYCLHCDAERFFITASHEVGCASCGSIIQNLEVVEKK